MYLFPHAVPMDDFIIRDDTDGRGQYIAHWSLPETPPTEEEIQNGWLEYLRTEKLKELKQSCQTTILGGFASANGHQYQFENQDQDNITQQMLFLVNDPTITSLQWKTKDVGVIAHTRDEFLQVCKDADTHKRSNFGKFWTLEAQLKSALTEEDINLIVW